MAEPVLRKGSHDPAVRDLQQALKALGHDPGPVDGVFGDTTESAVKAFQQRARSQSMGLSARSLGSTSTRPTRASPFCVSGRLAFPSVVRKSG
jgi:peptidoglycan hydrolase-like protein with peptidoglycan-binding domain